MDSHLGARALLVALSALFLPGVAAAQPRDVTDSFHGTWAQGLHEDYEKLRLAGVPVPDYTLAEGRREGDDEVHYTLTVTADDVVRLDPNRPERTGRASATTIAQLEQIKTALARAGLVIGEMRPASRLGLPDWDLNGPRLSPTAPSTALQARGFDLLIAKDGSVKVALRQRAFVEPEDTLRRAHGRGVELLAQAADSSFERGKEMAQIELFTLPAIERSLGVRLSEAQKATVVGRIARGQSAEAALESAGIAAGERRIALNTALAGLPGFDPYGLEPPRPAWQRALDVLRLSLSAEQLSSLAREIEGGKTVEQALESVLKLSLTADQRFSVNGFLRGGAGFDPNALSREASEKATLARAEKVARERVAEAVLNGSIGMKVWARFFPNDAFATYKKSALAALGERAAEADRAALASQSAFRSRATGPSAHGGEVRAFARQQTGMADRLNGIVDDRADPKRPEKVGE